MIILEVKYFYNQFLPQVEYDQMEIVRLETL